MDANEYHRLSNLAQEAFIRRSSMVNMPFMLKGSYVTKQYFPAHVKRIPADLDWVYMHYINDEKSARTIFNAWVLAITETHLQDDVKFRSFKENEFWRMMDYAMADDFPTVNTDIKCWVDGNEIDFPLDVSFNLDLEYGSVPLEYQPSQGEVFSIQHTVPLSLQVAWKIHQTLARARFKDLFDLMYLVQHPSFNNEVLMQSFKALINECYTDDIENDVIYLFLSYDMTKFFDDIHTEWRYWRKPEPCEPDMFYYQYNCASLITDAGLLPEKLDDFLDEFKTTLTKAGFGVHLMDSIVGFEAPDSQKMRSYQRVNNSLMNFDTRMVKNEYSLISNKYVQFFLFIAFIMLLLAILYNLTK